MRIVYKIGSSLLTNENGELREDNLRTLAEQLAAVKQQGHEICVVSSGAVSAGMPLLGMDSYPTTLVERQAAAAAGQAQLAYRYGDAFSARSIPIALVLLTRAELTHRGRFVNARNTLLALLSRNVVPIINENDTVAVDELIVGDNDQLAALTSLLVQADLCVLLTDVDGMYRDINDPTSLLTACDDIAELETYVKAKTSTISTGGMQSKLNAARMNQRFGVPTIIANGNLPTTIERIAQESATGTRIEASASTRSAWQQWLRDAATPNGTVVVDDGAANALCKQGSSLLAKGIVDSSGEFGRGDAVHINAQSGTTIAIGITQYSASELSQIHGVRSNEIASILGYAVRDEVVHRNDLTLYTE